MHGMTFWLWHACANVSEKRQLLNSIVTGVKKKKKISKIQPVREVSQGIITFCFALMNRCNPVDPTGKVGALNQTFAKTTKLLKITTHTSLLRRGSNLALFCGTVKPSVWMSEDIAMCVEGSSCSTGRAEWCEQEVTWGSAVCRALLTLPGACYSKLICDFI